MSTHRFIIRHLLNAPMALADLQAASQVSLPTLRKVVQELTDARWIRVVGQAEANGGRPAMLFGLDDSFYLIVGIHLQLPGIRLITTDLSGQVLDEVDMFDKVVPSPGEAAQALGDYVAQVRRQYPGRPVLGVGIASPGFTDPATGDIISIGRVPGWHNFPICRRLQALTGVPVYIANDVDCMALAEFQHTGESFERNLAYVGFDEGVKVSLFLNGELYRGSLGNAGLIAVPLLHVRDVADQNAVKELLTLVGLSQLFEQRVAVLDAAEQAAYGPILQKNARQRVPEILQGAVEGLPVCYEITQQMIVALAVAVANVVYMIQPDVIVIGGALSGMSGSLSGDLKRAIASYLPRLIDHHVMVQQAALPWPGSAACGATQHFLQSYLNDPGVDALQPG